MKGLFNNEIIGEEVSISVQDRALQYGDGLFETIAVKDGQAKYLRYHLERLKKGGEVLKLDTPSFEYLETDINKLLNVNKQTNATFKLIVWRKASNTPGYSFNSSECNIMILCKPTSNFPRVIEKADFAMSIHFHYSKLSSIKTLNSLPYILAAREKYDRQLDELIVLNNDGYVCECVSSNLFWQSNGKIYTSPVSSGCLAGVARRVVIERFAQMGQPIEEKLIKPDELIECESIFTTNSSGIKFISSIGDKHFDTSLVDNEAYSI